MFFVNDLSTGDYWTILSSIVENFNKVYWLLFTRKINTFLKLINHPEINCNMMSIPHKYHNIMMMMAVFLIFKYSYNI